MTTSDTPPHDLPTEVQGLSVQGRNLAPGGFGAQLGAGPTLLVFLRHLG